MHFHLSLIVQRPREQVFDFLADPRNRPLWQASLSSIELEGSSQLEGSGEPGVGTRWFEQPKGGPRFQMTVVEHDPHVRWAEEIESKQATGTIALSFGDVPEGTLLQAEVRVNLHGLFKLGDPLAGWILKREMRKDLARVEALIPTPDVA